jgi:hypothetical protein
MNDLQALELVYNYRLVPDPAVVPVLFNWTRVTKILHDPHTALPWSGVITGLYDRHGEQQKLWKELHGETLDRAFRVARHYKSPLEVAYADYLAYRWLILNTDREAWELLLRAHHKYKDLAQGAQRCIEKIMTGTAIVRSDGRPVLDSRETMQGSYQFPDMRDQMIALTKEFRRMTWEERRRPFSLLPFSPEFRLRLTAQLVEAQAHPLVQ